MPQLRRILAVSLVPILSACSQLSVPPPVVPPLLIASPTATPWGTTWPAPSPPVSPTPTASDAVTDSPAPTATPVPTASASASPTPSEPPTCAIQTLDAMSEAQRIGELFMIGLTDDRLGAPQRHAIAEYHIGSVLFARRTTVGVSSLRAVADAVQAQASDGVALFVAANQEGGQVQALSGPGFDTMPSALEQGSMSTAELTRLAGRWGQQLKAAGVNLDLAPVGDVVPPGTDEQNMPIGHYDREYEHDPATAAPRVAAFIAGMRAAGVGTTVKHFPGLGRVAGNTDDTDDVTDTETTRADPYLQPFATAIAAGAPFAMISEATYQQIDPTHMAVLSDTVINGMLRGDLGFRGVVISDSLGSAAVAAIPPGTRAIDFLDAGGDMIVLNQLDQAIAMIQSVQTLAATKDWFRARIDNAAWHVLRAKEAAGLLSCPR